MDIPKTLTQFVASIQLDQIDYILLSINIAALIFSGVLFRSLYKDNKEIGSRRFRTAFLISIVFLGLQIVDKFTNLISHEEFLKGSYTLITLYLGLLAQSIIHYVSKKNFGEVKEVDGKKEHFENAQSRMIVILGNIFVLLIEAYTIIKIFGADSMLTSTGAFGFLIAAVAFTNSVWLPDIYKGVFNLKSKMMEVGDVVQLNNEKDLYIVRETTLTYTVFLSITDNTRVLKFNNVISSKNIKNLTKSASLDGLRKTLTYKIGYPKIDDQKRPGSRKIYIKKYIAAIREMADNAYQECLKDETIHISDKQFEIRVKDAGDFAIEFVLSYYIKPLPKTKLTSKVREYLIKTPLKVNENILISSYELGIDLSTPVVEIATTMTYPTFFEDRKVSTLKEQKSDEIQDLAKKVANKDEESIEKEIEEIVSQKLGEDASEVHKEDLKEELKEEIEKEISRKDN